MDNPTNSDLRLASDPTATFKYPDIKGAYFPWVKDIIPNYIIPQITRLAEFGLKPTIRGLLYHLESRRVIPKTDRIYENLIKAMSTARKGRKLRNGTRGKPTIKIDAFEDNTRHIIKDFNDEERSLEDYINDGIAHFRNLPNGFKTLVPRWLNQPNYVEVWVEKTDWANTVKKILQDRDVVIVPNRGNTSIIFFHENVERLQDWSDDSGKDVHVLYIGDLDPSGWAMDNYMEKELAEKCASRVTFKRIGITYEQIVQYLPHLLIPTPDVLAKLSNPKLCASKSFKEHFGSLFQVELNAMEDIPNFGKLITDRVDELYDEDVHRQVLSRPEYSQEPNVIRHRIKKALTRLIDELDSEDECE